MFNKSIAKKTLKQIKNSLEIARDDIDFGALASGRVTIRRP